MNKHEFESFLSEVLLVKQEIKLFTKKLKRWSRKKRVGGSIFNFPSKNYLIPEPYGNTLIITPWNYPFQLSLTPLIGAVAAGNTVVVIEHNLDVIKTADYIVDMGPEGGVKGGNIIAEGKPEEVCKVPGSYTGQYLKPLLK